MINTGQSHLNLLNLIIEMSRKKGDPKTGGRQKGTKNKRTTALHEAIKEQPARYH